MTSDLVDALESQWSEADEALLGEVLKVWTVIKSELEVGGGGEGCRRGGCNPHTCGTPTFV